MLFMNLASRNFKSTLLYSSVTPEICRVFCQIQWRFLRGISGKKNYIGRIFQKFCANQGYPLPKLVKFRTTFWNFILSPYCAEIIHTSTFICCLNQVRRHVHKQITEGRYGLEKPGRFVYEKPVLFTLGLGLTTSYSLVILVWNFYHTFVTVSTEFWLRFEPQIRPTRMAINFLFITARDERKVRLCVELFVFFVGEYSSVWPEICRVLSQILWRYLRGISGKNYFGRIFQKFYANQGYPLPKLVKFRHTFSNFILGPYCAEKIHTSTFIGCFLPGKEARP